MKINKTRMKWSVRIGTPLVIIVVLFAIWTKKASFQRMSVNVQSDLNNGLERKITVYNADGKTIMSEKGKFDISHTSRSLQYIDQHHQKHNIYFGDNTTVVVDEMK